MLKGLFKICWYLLTHPVQLILLSFTILVLMVVPVEALKLTGVYVGLELLLSVPTIFRVEHIGRALIKKAWRPLLVFLVLFFSARNWPNQVETISNALSGVPLLVIPCIFALIIELDWLQEWYLRVIALQGVDGKTNRQLEQSESNSSE